MSRSGYSDDGEDSGLWLYRANVDRAIAGKRGQKFLRDLVEALDAMSIKELIEGVLQEDDPIAFIDSDGRLLPAQVQVCAIGSVGLWRGMDMSELNPDYTDVVAKAFGIGEMLVRETVYENDEGSYNRETPAQRWQRMRDWAVKNLKDTV